MKTLIYLFLALLCISQHVTAQVPSYVPTDGLVAYYPFNGNANDESGNGNNGTVNGATLTSDKFDNNEKAYSFDGSETFITIPNDFFDGTENGTYTINFWTKYSETNTSIFNKGGSYKELNIGILNNGKLRYSYWPPANATRIILESNTSLEPNNWYNVSITHTGGIIKLYINDNLDSELQTDIIFNWSTSINSACAGVGMHFGKDYNNCGRDRGYYGVIDDFGIWNRALTEEEITNLYNSNSSNECSTLVINTGVLSTNPVAYNSTVNIYPNPANDQITIDCGNLDNVEGWNIKITNILGQEVFSQPMNTQQYVIPLNTWTGQGMYFVKIINAQNEVVNIKKIVLQ